LLTVGTTVSFGFKDIASAAEIQRLEEQAQAQIAEMVNFEYSEFEINLVDSYLKQALLEYNRAGGFVDSETLDNLEEYLYTSDPTFVYTENLQSKFLIQPTLVNDDEFIQTFISSSIISENNSLGTDLITSNLNIRGSDLFGTGGGNTNGGAHADPGLGEGSSSGNTGSSAGNGDSSSSTSPDSPDNPDVTYPDILPLKYYDPNNLVYGSNVPNFIGFQANEQACLAVYDGVVDSLKSFIMGKATNSPGMQEILSGIVAMLRLAAPEAITSIVSFFTGIWSQYAALLGGSLGPIGVIVALILTMLVALAVYIIGGMFVAGHKDKGFQVGWKTFGDWRPWKWTWVAGVM
jgi:hypothetical protein